MASTRLHSNSVAASILPPAVRLSRLSVGMMLSSATRGCVAIASRSCAVGSPLVLLQQRFRPRLTKTTYLRYATLYCHTVLIHTLLIYLPQELSLWLYPPPLSHLIGEPGTHGRLLHAGEHFLGVRTRVDLRKDVGDDAVLINDIGDAARQTGAPSPIGFAQNMVRIAQEREA